MSQRIGVFPVMEPAHCKNGIRTKRTWCRKTLKNFMAFSVLVFLVIGAAKGIPGTMIHVGHCVVFHIYHKNEFLQIFKKLPIILHKYNPFPMAAPFPCYEL